ncbi:MAG: serine hydrolase [Actinomycetota bacterium]|nr:serine hydrolase [Actinomycetota bacterium]
MSDSAITVPAQRRGRLLDGHSRGGRPRPPMDDAMPAAGSLRSSVEDVLRFLAACCRPPEGPLGDALRLAQQPHAQIGKHMQTGLCWLILDRPSRDRSSCTTAGRGVSQLRRVRPAAAAAVVVMTNTGRSVDHLGLRLLDEVAQPAAGS